MACVVAGMPLLPASRQAVPDCDRVISVKGGCGSKRARSSDKPAGSSAKRARSSDKRARSSVSKRSTSTNHENITQEIPMHNVWKQLPEELLDIIVSRVPFAAQCRFRAVCKKWKELRSLPPPSMVLKNLSDQEYRFYCASEKKWFPLPSNNRPPPFGGNPTWDVADVDGGLVCYQCEVRWRYWLWVCNPLKPSSSRLIMPDYHREPLREPKPPPVKLIVDRVTKSFKIVLTLDKPPKTAVYDSIASSWRVYNDIPHLQSREFFALEDVVYAYDANRNQRKRGRQNGGMGAFNWDLGKWVDVQVELPSEVQFPTNHFFLSDNEQVILVLYSCRKRPRPYFSVWKLFSEGLSSPVAPAGDLKWDKWRKIDLRSEADIVNLQGYRVVGACLGPGSIYFTFSGDRCKESGSEAQRCVRYSFPAKTWSLVSSSEAEGWRKTHSFHSWEPCPDIDPRFTGAPSTPQ